MDQRNKTKKISPDMEDVINAAIQKSLEVFSEKQIKTDKGIKTKDSIKKTESRLSAMPILNIKIRDDKERVKQLQTIGSPERSKSIIRYSKPSSRIDPEEALEAMIKEINAAIAADSYELDTIRKALQTVKGDAYYYTMKGKYEEGLDNETIAQKIGCDVTTVWRNRQRLIKILAIRLYGTEAMD